MENNSGIVMPEIILYNFLNTIQKIVKDDWIDKVDKKESMLFQLFGNDLHGKRIALETYDYFTQAERIIIKNGLQVNIGYNTEVSKLGCIHILLPSETSETAGVGGNEGYEGYLDFPDYSSAPIFTQQYNTTYNLLISSENSMEVVIIYNFLKACFLSLHDNLELYGLQNLKMSGNDIQMQTDLVPTHIFHRSLTLSFGYEMSVPKLYTQKLAKSFKLTGIILPLKADNEII